MASPEAISPAGFESIHRSTIASREAIAQVLRRVRRSKVELDNGFDGASRARSARIRNLTDEYVELDTRNIDGTRTPQLCFNFEIGAERYFFASEVVSSDKSDRIRIAWPGAMYKMERRDLRRMPPERVRGAPTQVSVLSLPETIGRVEDVSPSGMGLALESVESLPSVGSPLRIRLLDGAQAGEQFSGFVRYAKSESTGWVKLGLALADASPTRPVRVERLNSILPAEKRRRAIARRLTLLTSGAAARVRPFFVEEPVKPPRVVEYPNDRGEPIRAILDSHGEGPGGAAVIIPPAWGRTKETLLPLARTIVSCFAAEDERVTVVRFDGTHRRGESFIEPKFRLPGHEYLGFTFSQAVRDIHATARYLQSDPMVAPRGATLVTVSIGSVEGRRAVAENPSGLINGWVALVGIVDLQSCLKTASGGIDYPYGLSQGVRFGLQELTGVAVDMDTTGPDAMVNGLAYLEDAKRDMSRIAAPVTWIHGRYDGWVSIHRVQQLLEVGEESNRKLIEIPVGHQLRSSRQALDVFELVASEVGAIATGREMPACRIDLTDLLARQRGERERRRPTQIDLRTFWTDYLLGRSRRIGIDLMTATAAYQELLRAQVQMLGLRGDEVVLDLGAGTCELVGALAEQSEALRVVAVDFVADALARGREKAACQGLVPVLADLDQKLPLMSDAFDAAVLSLVLGYLRDPEGALRELYRVLKPGAVAVISSLRRDADNSRLYADARAQLADDRVRELVGKLSSEEIGRLKQDFMNDNAKLFTLEDEGVFRFWDTADLAALVQEAGFEVCGSSRAFGTPPQVVIVLARRPV